MYPQLEGPRKSCYTSLLCSQEQKCVGYLCTKSSSQWPVDAKSGAAFEEYLFQTVAVCVRTRLSIQGKCSAESVLVAWTVF